MELKHNKKAVTLVELIIALTMVSVLMVMMFGVIFKKTKAMVLSPTGTFYCWKDWDGKLHQRIIYSSGSRVVTETKNDVANCELNFPKYVTKDANSIKAHIIGGGASGDYYMDGEFIPSSNSSNRDPNIVDDLENEANCYKRSSNSYCISHNPSTFAGLNCYDCSRSLESNYDNRYRLISGCYVNLRNSGNYNKYESLYKVVNNPSNYFYNDGDSSDCGSDLDVDRKRIKALIRKDDKYVINPLTDNTVVEKITAVNNTINYNVNSKIKFNVLQPSKYQNSFTSVDIADKIDRNTIYKIHKSDIGNGGKYIAGQSQSKGSGKETVLRVKYKGAIIKEAPGVEYNSKKTVYRNLITQLDAEVGGGKTVRDCVNSPDDKCYLYLSGCCNGKSNECNFNTQNTGIAQLVGLKNPDLPEITNNTCSGSRQLAHKFNPSPNPTGFGLFGYNGFPNDIIYQYKPFRMIKIYDTIVNGLWDYNPKEKSRNPEDSAYPGMGGAIIIQWN